MDKIPPHVKDLEEAVLGSLLLDPDSIERVRSMLSPECFYDPAHGRIYGIIEEMERRDKKVDILTVTQELQRQKALEFVGGASFIVSLTSRVGSSAHIQEHAAIIYDKFVKRELIKIGNRAITQGFDEGVDAVDALNDSRDSLDKRLMHLLGLNSFGVEIQEAAQKSLTEYHNREKMIREGVAVGVRSPLGDLDKFTAGWQPEQLIVLAARPAMGKTSFAMACLMEAAKNGKSVAMYSLEMSSTKLTDKVICSLADIDLTDYKKGKLMDHQKEAAERSLDVVRSWNVTFSDEMMSSMDKILASAQSIKTRKGLDLIIIDYLQLMEGKGDSREAVVSKNSRAAKMMAVKLGCPVILLSQLNRGLEARTDKRPMLSDLRESGAIEQDADIVLFLYREHVYNESAPDDKGELIIAKHREGPTGYVEFKHNKSMTKFESNLPF